MAKTNDATKDAETLKALMLWAREQGIAVQSLSVGEVQLVGSDRKLKYPSHRDEKPAKEEHVPSMLDELAGPLASFIGARPSQPEVPDTVDSDQLETIEVDEDP